MLKLNSKVAQVAAAAVMASAATVATAGATTGNLTVGATLTAGCTVQAGTIAFGNIIALAATGNVTADSGTTFKVACSNGAVPTIATTTTREMSDGASAVLPFQLSMTAGAAADDFPSSSPASLSLVQDGTLKTVTIYAKVLASDFTGANAKPVGAYTQTVVVDVAY
jgi:spore coat protein U-like protein